MSVKCEKLGPVPPPGSSGVTGSRSQILNFDARIKLATLQLSPKAVNASYEVHFASNLYLFYRGVYTFWQQDMIKTIITWLRCLLQIK